MPEKNELQAHYETAEYYREDVLEDDCDVLAVWGDCTKKEGEVEQTIYRTDGHVFEMGPDEQFTRGNQSCQTLLMPKEALRAQGSSETPSTIAELNLKWVSTHVDGRALYMDFGDMYLKTNPLTHTSIQCYTREIWENSVLKVDKQDRGFKVGLALEFKNHFIAFVTNDLVFQVRVKEYGHLYYYKLKDNAQPEWKHHDPALVGKPAVERFGIANDVIRDYTGMVAGITDWILERQEKKRTGLACDAMRSASTVWVGLGVYTVCEVFNIAGVSLHLSEKEVFECPSRVGRLCEAFWTWAHMFRDGFQKLVKPAICKKTHLLAPTVDQRIKYKDYLAVYAKSEMRMTKRRAELLHDYKKKLEAYARLEAPVYRDEITNLYDVFEPELMVDALTLSVPSKELTFGHLIFGRRKWKSWGYKCSLDDPLTTMFITLGLWDAAQETVTDLNLEAYTTLLNPDGEAFSTSDTYLYFGTKQMWCPAPGFPANLSATRPPPDSPKANRKAKSKKRAKEPTDDTDDGEDGDGHDVQEESKKKHIKKEIPLATEAEKKERTFEHIVRNTKEVAIGPLEYAGHGKTIKGARGKIIRFAVNGDPRLSRFYQIMSLWPIFAGKGENQQKMTTVQENKMVQRASKTLRSSSPIPPSSSSSPPPSPTQIFASVKWLKRRRSGGSKENEPPSTPPRKKFKRLHDD